MKNIDLKQYLKKVLDLEISLYQQDLVYNHIENQIEELEKRINTSPQLDKKYEITNVSKKVLIALKYHVLTGFAIGVVISLICSIPFTLVVSNLIVGGMIGAYIAFAFGMLFFDVDDMGDGLDCLANGAVLSFWSCIIIPVISIIISIIRSIIIHSWTGFWKTIIPIALILSTIILIIAILISILEKKNFIKENRLIDENNMLYQKNFEAMRYANESRRNELQEELDELADQYNETLEIVNKLYDLDIIYDKYQGLIPVSSFYEYIVSGRCNSLTGPSGAYNLYENEAKMNIIITKLDEINEKLDIIAQNQCVLIDEMRKANNLSFQINSKIDKLTTASQSLIQNTEIIGYHSMITAQNTEVLKWMELGKLIEKSKMS